MSACQTLPSRHGSVCDSATNDWTSSGAASRPAESSPESLDTASRADGLGSALVACAASTQALAQASVFPKEGCIVPKSTAEVEQVEVNGQHVPRFAHVGPMGS